MRALHDSRALGYRSPYGAAQVGGVVALSVDVWDDPGAKASIRTWVDGVGEKFYPMEQSEGPDGARRFTGHITAEPLGILWYCFVLEGSDGVVRYYGAKEGRTGGVGQMYNSMPPSFQITVYHERAIKPEWYRNGIVYQIFPDRYKRGADWADRVRDAFAQQRKAPESRSFVDNWDTPVWYNRDANGNVNDWNFYGGTLEGIREELPRLAERGFTAIYLNPIFEALSNHRYDTADYMKIDPMLGDDESFKRLCADAEKVGISIILDGVFNHTGTDSKYFNKFGTYPEPGAWQGKESPYYPWYLIKEDGSYTCWWGVDNMPDLDKHNPEWQNFVYGEDGVVEHWLKMGARGWRLDVADELNDQFIAGIKAAEDRVKPDALLLGEVWEDASNKVAYGEMRHYLDGYELDSVMNYPFREALLEYLTGEWPAEEMVERMSTLKENYPRDAFYETLNLLGSHDRTRLFTILGGAPDADSLNDHQKHWFRLNPGERDLAKHRMWLAVLVQMCSPGVPCVYYGDDAGVEGFTDPYNRSTYPWGHEDEDVQTLYANAINLRKQFPIFTDGEYMPFSAGPDVYGFYRYHADENGRPKPGEEVMCVVVNRNLDQSHEVWLPRLGEQADELVDALPLRMEENHVVVNLPNLGSAVIRFHAPSQLAKPFERGAGVMAHITSVPRTDGQEPGPGTLGPEAYRFVDFLSETGQRYWQVLPVNPVDKHGSPYAGLSAFAGEPSLVDRDGESWEKLYTSWCEGKPIPTGRGREVVPRTAYTAFARKNSRWLKAYATFMAIRDTLRADEAAAKELGKPLPKIWDDVEPGDLPSWADWKAPYKNWSPNLATRKELTSYVKLHQFQQFLFQIQWDNLKKYANEHDVEIVGDMPIYVSMESSDVWSNRKMFNLDATGHQTEVAGVPGDDLAPEGQIWGNPTYNWPEHKKDNYGWWLARLGRAFELYDRVRLDHFVGFQNYYVIQEGQKASEGRWLPGPSLELFEKAAEKFGPLPVIAEDLGTITPVVRGLMSQTGFPGMDVIPFYKGGDIRQGFTPIRGKAAYTSTHDTDTLMGSLMQQFGIADWGYARHLTWSVVAMALHCADDLVMVPLQDVLGLASGARMNVPGQEEGNWKWQADWESIDYAKAGLKHLTEESGRATH